MVKPSSSLELVMPNSDRLTNRSFQLSLRGNCTRRFSVKEVSWRSRKLNQNHQSIKDPSSRTTPVTQSPESGWSGVVGFSWLRGTHAMQCNGWLTALMLVGHGKTLQGLVSNKGHLQMGVYTVVVTTTNVVFSSQMVDQTV